MNSIFVLHDKNEEALVEANLLLQGRGVCRGESRLHRSRAGQVDMATGQDVEGWRWFARQEKQSVGEGRGREGDS